MLLKTINPNLNDRPEVMCSIDKGRNWEPVVFCLHCFYGKPISKINERYHHGKKIIIPLSGLVNQTFICHCCQDYHNNLVLSNKSKIILEGCHYCQDYHNNLMSSNKSKISLEGRLGRIYEKLSLLFNKINNLGHRYPKEIMAISSIGFIFGKLLK